MDWILNNQFPMQKTTTGILWQSSLIMRDISLRSKSDQFDPGELETLVGFSGIVISL